MATDADLTHDGNPGVASRPSLRDTDPLDELQRLVSVADPFRSRAPP